MWLEESNRLKHFWYSIPIGFIGTILMVIGVAFGMEFKDKMYGAEFDWLDIAAGLLGGLVGQILQIIVIWLIF